MIGMKAKLTFLMLAVMILFSVTPAYAVIESVPTYTDMIIGTVYYNNAPYAGATVNATCAGGNKSSVETTNGDGFYSLKINCSAPSTVTVDAYAGGNLFGTASGVMHVTWLNVDMTYVDVTMIPVFGLIAIPFLLSMAGFVFMRKKK